MNDFFSSFWGYYIAIGVIVSIGFCLFVLRANRTNHSGKSDKPELHGHVWDGDLQEYNNPLPRWWMGLFYITIVFGLAYVILYPGLGTFRGYLNWNSKTAYNDEQKKAEAQYAPLYKKYEQQDVKAVAANPEARATGQRLFLTNCAQCHGSDAGGSKGFPNLSDKDWLYGSDPKVIETSITEGRNGAMPAFGKQLSQDQIKDVAYYVLSLSGFPANGLQLYGGKKVFMNTCAACHGGDGKGNQMIGAPNLTDNIWLHGGSPETIMETITKGRNSHMPAHKTILDSAKIHLLTAYVYGLSNDAETASVEDQAKVISSTDSHTQ